MKSCLQPDDGVGVEERLDLGLRDAEAEVGHELLPRVRLDHPRQHRHVLLTLQAAPDDLHQLKQTLRILAYTFRREDSSTYEITQFLSRQNTALVIIT